MAGDNASALAVRRAVRLFSTRAIRPVLAQAASAELDDAIGLLRSELGLRNGTSNGVVVDASYDLLATSHRNEYVYKNLITSKIFVGRHRVANSAFLNEFRVGAAIADSVLVNGQATVYEIKTELDNPSKLRRQLKEYYRAFPRVNVVVHESVVPQYASLLRGTPTGLVSVGSRWRLSTVKAIEEATEQLCTRTMFNTLRAREIEFLLTTLGFELPDVPNGIRYDRYLKMAMQVSALAFHEAYRAVIKDRRLSGDVSLYRDPRLFPLWGLLVQLDPGRAEGENLLAWLSRGE